jgi:phosphopantothenoylcysteine decarboxylase/phosphopantothenate--cysteine ligase
MADRRPRILLAVSGGIAAYKAPELVRLFQKSGCDVRCMITESAKEFVSELTLETLTCHRIARRLWGEGSLGTEHIDWARWPDIVLVAPATAQTLARLAHGFADDFVSTVALATRAPIVVAPAMNSAMWENAATRANLELLRTRSVQIIEPASGVLACGEEGEGKLAELSEIHSRILSLVGQRLGNVASPSACTAPIATGAPQDWSGRTILITAGPTRTHIDAVRYITNPSTGLMGKALAEEALRRGAAIHYILGIDKGVVRPEPANADESARLHLMEVRTAAEMLEAALTALPSSQGVIATAAVMDYEVAGSVSGKLKRSTEDTTLRLTPAPDVLATLRSEARNGQWFVGFAAETDSVAENGAIKLAKKSLDFVFANPVARTGEEARTGFGTTSNSGYWIRRSPKTGDGPIIESWPLVQKTELASRILDALPSGPLDSGHA